ncbi:hypothetical protein PMZ80_007421 [Knufia obscura]|uniref:Uncharacterized protein n=1 Tax=Knufia obscura TaxID=1635080 RepID=A0ABR0RHA2_9EURO|nr:hypothetical protein PMZ80_007421 [Knufia obscura]
MSLTPYTFRPLTPPEADSAAGQRTNHMRNVSGASYFTNTSPESLRSTPDRTVYRQHGPTLLPKIRTQDNNLQPSAGQMSKGHKRSVSNVSNTSTYNNVRPPMYRCATEPVHDSISLMSPVSMASQSRASSVAPFISDASRGHSRAVSSSSVDDSMLNRYGYPTYRQLPVYVTQAQQAVTPPIYAQSYLPSQQLSFLDAPTINLEGSWDMPIDLDDISRPTSMSPPPSLEPSLMPAAPMMQEPASYSMQGGPVLAGTTSLMNYLTQPTQPVNLVRNLTYSTGRGLSSYFWWDVRNLRPWTSFSLDTMSSIPDLMTLLHFQHDNNTFPSLATQTTSAANPSSEGDLANLISKIHFPKVNAAAQVSLGQNAPFFYVAPQQPTAASTAAAAPAQAQPTFLANYPNENQFTIHGSPRGRVVGLSKSFDTFNTSMRHESPAQRVRYLKTLSQLQKCMRDHSCRYGFTITEIELVCVRVGSDKYGNPYFGYLEVADSIATKTSAKYGIDVAGNYTEDISMTAGLALYFLLMLAKKVALPGEWGSFMDVGGLGAMTRQRVLPSNDDLKNDALPHNEDGDIKDEEERKPDGRDKWMPEPQVGEKRDAKTARGWVWPSDPWHKREGGRRSRRG